MHPGVRKQYTQVQQSLSQHTQRQIRAPGCRASIHLGATMPLTAHSEADQCTWVSGNNTPECIIVWSSSKLERIVEKKAKAEEKYKKAREKRCEMREERGVKGEERRRKRNIYKKADLRAGDQL